LVNGAKVIWKKGDITRLLSISSYHIRQVAARVAKCSWLVRLRPPFWRSGGRRGSAMVQFKTLMVVSYSDHCTIANHLVLICPSTSGVRQNFYTERVINLWNSLPPTVIFTSLSSIRRTICNVIIIIIIIIIEIFKVAYATQLLLGPL